MNNRVAVAISGSGRTLENLCLNQSNYQYEICAVISSSAKCKGNVFAKKFNIPILIADFSTDKSLETSKEVEAFLIKHKISWIALAGFLKPFPIIAPFKNNIINIHPALLPAYGGKGMYGMNVHRSVFNNNDQFSGATIHFVSEKYDDGQIISQSKTDVSNAQNAEEIAASVFQLEKTLYPKTLDHLISKKPNNFPISLEMES